MDRRLSAGAGAAMGSTGMSAAMDTRLSAEAAAHTSGMPMSAMGGMGARRRLGHGDQERPLIHGR